MIKISDLNYFESIKNAQTHVGAHHNYLVDILAPAIEHGDWDKFELLDIGFTVTGESLGKIGDNEAWKKLQPILEPNYTKSTTLDFTLNGQVIERNLRNQLKALVIKMMWISHHDYSMHTMSDTLKNLKKCIPPLLETGYNSFEYVDFNLLDAWALTESTNIDFERQGIYTAINQLFTEARGLPFPIAIKKKLSAKEFGLTIKEAEQYTVIPQRLYYLGLQKSEALINSLYPVRDELGKLSTYLATYFDKLYQGYAKYLASGKAKTTTTGKYVWYLSSSNKNAREKKEVFKKAFMKLRSPTEVEVFELLEAHKPEIKNGYQSLFHPNLTLKIAVREISGFQDAQSLFKEFCGGCLWGLVSRSGMRADEVFHLHTAKGCTTETISKQVIHVLHADLSKTVKGIQSKQDEFVTIELGKKAYEVLQVLHEPLRKLHPDSTRFFHKIEDDCSAINKASLSKYYRDWFDNSLEGELALTKEDIADLKVSDPDRSFHLGEDYAFTGHQLRRSFAYYLIGYELLSFPQLKQQFSHISFAMTRHYARNASKFQKLRKKKQNLCHTVEEERITQQAQVYLDIYQKLANKERIAGGKGKEFAKRRVALGERNLFKDKVDNDMLSLTYWKRLVRDGKRHIHAVAPGVYCTSTECSLRTQVNLLECVDCPNDYIVDAVFAEAKRKEAEINMLYDIEHDELTPQTASESYIKITAAERIMTDLGIDYEPVVLPNEVQKLLIPHTGAPA
ncbi:site-specific integrase [Vibrio parahaemolyticus]|uniref:site-specific integrase n=1 Tax=Vibrio parahaemolyticus TaxID=670 RepID=UPI001D165794|nr:site-specific integrase [Vibrio parahaemolyticus]MCC3857348.1 site-specific integrase [Vibrio parahaemolyticus]